MNVSELRAIVGMLNYYSKFIPNFAEKMHPLYELLRKNVKFNWTQKCQQAYIWLKTDVTNDQILVHFNPNLPIVLTTDASNNAVAGILSHRFSDNTLKPVAFVSRALTISEKNYITLEKEALAIIFCVTKLKQYLLGNQFILRTDHKPLTTLLGENKALPLMASARVQRWLLTSSGFDYNVEYVKGIVNDADKLSRIPQIIASEDHVECNYVNVIEEENFLNIHFKVIGKETRRDPILSKVKEAVNTGTVHKLRGDEFAPFREKALELSIEYDCILWVYRTVIPQKLRKYVLEELHRSHFGIVKTKALARSYVWSLAIDKDIEKLIRGCNSCQQLLPDPEKAELRPWTPSESAWSRIHIDFAGPIKHYYFLILTDSYTKWVEVFKTKTITSSFTIDKLREVFCRYGLVNTLVSDNGRQFTSHEFQKFLKLNHVKHILTAPGHPSTNGQA